jgi:hypothetical protein
MKIHFEFIWFATLFCGATLTAQEHPVAPSAGAISAGASASGDYATDVAVVRDAQKQVLEQARELLGQSGTPEARRALETAIQRMEQATATLEEARRSPEKLSAALSAQKAAYEALLKIIPREYRMSRSRSNSGQSAGQPNRRELDQLEMTEEENRYETERQANAAPASSSDEQSRVADRLKQLARRQQDLNDRLRELQTALQEARTDQQREEIERQLKRLRDEQRQMLSDMDDLRQDLAQSPNSRPQNGARRQLEQTRTDMQRAAEELERQGVSQALAAGTRAEQGLQNAKEDLRKQSSGRFNEQMRQLRSQARELARQENDIARGMQALANSDHPSLDDSAERQQLSGQLSRQQSALTNLLSGMRAVTEQTETAEPLVSRQLYDMLRRADQLQTDNLLETSQQLVERGFLPQAGEAEQSARRNIDELRQGIERAAEQVLGNETESLRYAQKELDDLARQVGGELGSLDTNSLNEAGQSAAPAGDEGTNSSSGRTMASATREDRQPDRNSPRGRAGSGETPSTSEQQQPDSAPGQSNRDGGPAPANQRDGNASASQPDQTGNNSGGDANTSASPQNGSRAGSGSPGTDRLRQLVEQLGAGGDGGALTSGPILGNNFVNWSDRLRDVEEALDAPDLRNQLAAVRERVAGLRAEYRLNGRLPQAEIVRTEILTPMTQVRVWLQEELARRDNASSLVPLDRDPVPEKYSEQVRHYYEKLGSAQ